MFPLNKKSLTITPLVILFALIGGTLALTFQASTNIFFALLLIPVLFIISFVNTDFAIILIILSTFLMPAVKIGEIPTREVMIRTEDILLLVVVAGWIAKVAIYKEVGLLKSTLLNKPIAAYVLVCLVSTFLAFADYRKDPKDAFFFLLKYFEYFLLFFMVANNCKSLGQVKRFINFMLLVYFLACLWGLKQLPLGTRVSAPFGENEPNTFSGYLILMISMVMGLMLHAETGASRLFYFILLIIGTLPFLFTLSRGGLIAFVPMVAAMIIVTKRFKGQLMLVSVITLVLLPFLLPQAVQRRILDTFSPETSISILGRTVPMSESTASRIHTWNRAFDALKEHPFLGLGIPGGGVVDSQLPRVLIEVGIIGCFIFLWMLLALFKTGLACYRQTEHIPFAQGAGLGFICGLVGLFFHSFSAATFIIIRVMQPFWILAGIIAILPEIEKESLEAMPEST